VTLKILVKTPALVRIASRYEDLRNATQMPCLNCNCSYLVVILQWKTHPDFRMKNMSLLALSRFSTLLTPMISFSTPRRTKCLLASKPRPVLEPVTMTICLWKLPSEYGRWTKKLEKMVDATVWAAEMIDMTKNPSGPTNKADRQLKLTPNNVVSHLF
jgi:hypothetical protein